MPLSGKGFLILSLSAVMFITYSCDSGDGNSETGDPIVDGKSIYNDYCRICHGADGKLGLNNASDLANSVLGKEEMKDVITNGRNAMQPYKRILSEQEIDNVAKYILTFRRE